MLTGALGACPFYCSDSMVATFHKTSQSLGERWAEHQVIGGRPVLEWTGRKCRTYALELRLDSTLGSMPGVLIAVLTKLMEAHKPVPLLIGPQYCGTVVIESIDVEGVHWTGAGVMQVANVNVKCKGVTDGFF